jgi:transposase
MLRYGSGMPSYRLQGLQASLNVPLPDATQWQIVVGAVPGPRAAYEELIRQAAQAPLIHLDDTTAQILSLKVERNKLEAQGKTPTAKAINTSGLVAVLPQGRKVALYFTGHQHAGDNLSDILAQRVPPANLHESRLVSCYLRCCVQSDEEHGKWKQRWWMGKRSPTARAWRRS